jgi:hypothetical protein
VRNASSVWLAATMGCCECHSHKFDPFTQKDFYRFAAFFADVTETAVGRQSQTPIPSPEQATRLKQLDADLAAQRAKLTQVTPELAAARDAWELQSRADLAKKPPQWLPVKPATAVSRGGATLAVQGDLSVLASGKNPDKDTYTVTLATDLPHLTGLRLEALTHPSLANKSLSRANGNFVLTGVEVQARGKGPEKPQPVKLVKALADYEQAGFPAAHAIDADPATGWAVEGHVKVADRQAVFVFDKPLAAGPGTTLTVTLHFQSQYPAHTIGRFRLAVTSAEQPALGEAGLPADVLQALTTDPAKRTPAQAERLAAHFRGTSPLLASVRERVAALEGERDRLVKSFPTTLVTVAMATPRTVRVLPRGNWLDDSGEVVTPDVPTFLTPLNLPDRRAGRLDLARWLTSPDNPLTARVFVNRLWKLTFGQGIVRSIDDFGSQGTPPTHPELLDWLASEFMHPAADAADSPGGWDVKHMVRLMVLSRAYRQSSHADRAVRERDPGNLWLARQGRFRLDAELVRDNALAVSGLLTEKVGGPSVKPYCPPGYWSYMNFPTREYVADHGEAEYRRGLYTYWCRTFAHPSLLAFDAPTREECTVARPNSNTPLQALVLLNDPTYVEAARAFAARIIREGGPSTEGRLNWAFKRALARGARPEELKPLTDLLEKHRREYAAGPEAAKKLLGTGDAPPPKDVPPEELAAWASVARVILNLHETVTRE